MKPNRSRDGEYRANVRVSHRVSLDDVVNLLCHSIRNEVLDDVEAWAAGLTKTSVDRIVHDDLRFYGNDVPSYWRDDIQGDEEADDLEEQVRARVLVLYPEFSL